MRKNKLLLLLALLMTAATGAMAQETLLLTIENKDYTSFKSGSKTFDDKVTVTFSNEVYNDGDFMGWYTDSPSLLTVAGTNGYTITSCKFYTDMGPASTGYTVVGESPSVYRSGSKVYTDDSKSVNIGQFGITKIEVYGTEPIELTPDTDKKVWTLAEMPANNIELQVEYFAESNLFLSKNALADKANIAVTAGDLGVQFGDNGKSANTVTEGTAMTVKYNGAKKVIGVKAEKKAVAEGHALTSAKFGEIVCSDGKAYAAADKDILPKGVKAEALVCYADGDHGLALAMADVKNEKMSWDNDRGANDGKTAAEWCTGWNTSHPITGATWLLASKTQWDNMISAAGSASNLSNAFSAVGGTNLQAYSYWSSTPNHGGTAAWFYYFPSSSWQWTYLTQDETGRYIRACLEW